jgi:C1A family cysteine protease
MHRRELRIAVRDWKNTASVNWSLFSRQARENTITSPTASTMKAIINGEYYAVSGLIPTEERPNKCDDFKECGDGGGLPEQVDLRHLMTTVENQKSVGSCTANAVAGAYEYLCNVVAKQTNDQPGDISRLFIYYVARKYDQHQRDEVHLAVTDRGSTISGAISALTMKGACLEETHPYHDDAAYVNQSPSAESFDEALNYKISSSYKIPIGVDNFKYVLSLGYPIIFGCKLTEAFHKQGGKGIIPVPDPSDEHAAEHGLHAMLIVGYYDSHQVFVVRNSWGEDWGYGGYCFMPYDYLSDPDLILDENYLIQGLSNYDFTPDDGGCNEMPNFDENAEEGLEVEFVEDEIDDEEQEEEDFNPEEFFSELAEAKKVFDKFDYDGTGTMSMEEVASALMMNSQYVTEEVLENIKENRGDECLSFAEFLEILGIEAPQEEVEEEE